MKFTVLGIGAGGNKAAIEAIESGAMSAQSVKLLNTTLDDIPEKYKMGDSNIAVQFASALGGCGKQPSEGNKAIVRAIKNNQIDLASFIDEDTQSVVVVTSTEGGTGCGATPMIVKYYLAMNLPVHVFALIGFNDDTRGMDNTLKFFKNLDSNITLHVIRNTEFLDYTGNHSRAEQAANVEFANQLKILTGSKMIPSAQNIDAKDMYKIATTSGYMHIDHIPLTGIKNQEGFNKNIQNAFDNIKCFDFDKSAKRMGIIINASEKTLDAVDSTFEVIKRYIGEPYEFFKHIQNNSEDRDEYIDIIVSGMNFPGKAIKELSEEYKILKEKSIVKTNTFDDIFGDIDLDDEDEFDMDVRKLNNPAQVNDIFASMINEDTAVQNVVITNDKNDDIDEY